MLYNVRLGAQMRLIAWILVFFAIPVPQHALAEQSLWNHNGSIVGLEASGDGRKFFYVTPRADLPVAPGQILFQGFRKGFRYFGEAYRFSSRCGSIAYRVEGDVSPDERTVSLRGRAPRRDAHCNVRSYFEDHLYFNLTAAVETVPANQTDGASAEELAPRDARERAIKILLGNPYGSTPKEVDGNIVSQEFGVDTKCGSNRRAWVFHVIVKPSQSTPDGIDGYLTIDAVTGKPICIGLPLLD